VSGDNQLKNSTKLKTELGTLTVIWSDKGISQIVLPGSDFGEPRAKAQQSDLPKWLNDSFEKIKKHLAGQNQDLDSIPLDLSEHPEFHQKVYTRLKKLPAGQTVSYGKLADLIGAHGAARAVGTAMAGNKIPIVIPCHRVIKSDGSLGNYSALEGPLSKRQLLIMEGCEFDKNNRTKNKVREKVGL
jgi:methylated-DNA-[protein]-cysteine S-methyltransferase